MNKTFISIVGMLVYFNGITVFKKIFSMLQNSSDSLSILSNDSIMISFKASEN